MICGGPLLVAAAVGGWNICFPMFSVTTLVFSHDAPKPQNVLTFSLFSVYQASK